MKFHDWYNITHENWKTEGGGLLASVKLSLTQFLEDIYPEFIWTTWDFLSVPDNYWQIETIRHRLDAIALKLNIKQQSHWYNVTHEDIAKFSNINFAMKILRDFNMIFSLVYPEFKWEGFLFKSVKQKYWTDPLFVRKFLAYAAFNLHVQQLSEWYRISLVQLKKLGGEPLILSNQKRFFGVLKEVYSIYPWEEDRVLKIGGRKKAAQRWLAVTLRKIFSQVFQDQIVIHEDYKHPFIRFPETNFPMEFDVFVPSLSLAFEYQGQHHFNDVFGLAKTYELRDAQKRRACFSAGITFIEIRYDEWDGNAEWLKNEIKTQRPDLELKNI